MRGIPFAPLSRLLLVITVLFFAAILATTPAFADPNAPTVSVTFASVNNGNSTPTCGSSRPNGVGSYTFPQYRYGYPQNWNTSNGCPTGLDRLSQSGLGVQAFSNTPSLQTCTSQVFQLGKAWHFNQIIQGGNALPTPMTAAKWNVTYTGVANGDVNGTLAFNFTLDETDNDPNNHPNNRCPYPGGPNSNSDPINIVNGQVRCADSVSVQANGTFTVLGGPTCSIEVIGFNNGCPANPTQGQLSTTFLSSETTDNSSCIYAKVTAPQAITLASFEATGEGDDVRLNWETATEVDNLGFNLWRGTTLEDRVRINPELIPAQTPGGGQGAAYEYWDNQIGEGTYFYWLEDVDISGNTATHPPVSITLAAPTAVTVAEFEGAAASGNGWLLLGALALSTLLAISVRVKRG